MASPLNGMDLLTLRLLIAAREEGNLARVAERESIAISAVSRRISDFEGRYGVTILNRHDRGVTVTPEGELLLDRFAQALTLFEQVVRDMEEVRGGVRGFVRLRAHMTATLSGSLPHRLRDFLQAFPEVDIQLDEDTSLEVVHAVRVGACDIGFISGTVDQKGLELIPWMDDELMAALPAHHRLAGRETLSLADLIEEPFVGMQRGSALLTLYRTQAAAANQTLRERVHCTSFESVRSMVAAGLGVAILPAVACRAAPEGELVFRSLAEPWAHRPLMICVRQQDLLSAAAKRLLRFLIEAPATLGSA